jgi:hypothetical protein
VGSPETVAQKIVRMTRELRISRFDLKYDIGGLSVDARARTIELLGTKVAPRVRELLAEQELQQPNEHDDHDDHDLHRIGSTHA